MKNSQDRASVRQNTEYTASRKHAANLRRNPTLHFQIGLILALLVVIFLMEVRMPETSYNTQPREYDHEEAVWDEQFQIEKQVVEVVAPKIVEPKPVMPQLPDDFEVKPDDDTFIEEVIKGDRSVDKDISLPDPGIVPYVDIPETPVEVDFVRIEEAPLFPGCEGLDTNDERKACMSSKIKKFVNNKFDTGLGAELGLQGINRIFVQFTVDKKGNVTKVKSRGPHNKLEEEAQRVINLLPKMKPGRQGSAAVGVIYSLPIVFKVED